MFWIQAGTFVLFNVLILAARHPAAPRPGRCGEQDRHPRLELLRLTIPRRVYTRSHLDVVADSVIRTAQHSRAVTGLSFTHEPATLRFFQARFAPVPQDSGDGIAGPYTTLNMLVETWGRNFTAAEYSAWIRETNLTVEGVRPPRPPGRQRCAGGAQTVVAVPCPASDRRHWDLTGSPLRTMEGRLSVRGGLLTGQRS
ncbi:hypothetical protein [Saccharopolyspora sp. ASAGF58]|uniref:hypothetical protein n=1 Tax=Saccharopolyspora sp. ASAGF58 TaxID=2719023 RepID=UPI001B317296|nr:hypothetical protein [Saccharopolyspora sp. ASAGF58]